VINAAGPAAVQPPSRRRYNVPKLLRYSCGMADVAFSGVSKRYGDVSVIDDLNLHINDHELMVLVGPSGCGKSTALRMVAGLEEISAGAISIGGRRVNDLPPNERDIAMVFQSYALYPHMTVRENLEFGLRMRGEAKAEIKRRTDDAASILGIEHLLDRRPKDLSGGQRQRVAVGRAIVRQPAVFLFDEPLSNLDAKLRVQTRAEITKLQRSLGTTSIYVTHDQVEAMTMGQRITVMRAGKIQQVGTPAEVYERPANLFVGQFIGTPPMNVVAATIDDGNVRASSFSLAVPARLRETLANGRRVIAGIRPEHIRAAGASANGGVTVQAQVDVVEPVGHESIVYAAAGEERLVAIFPPQATPRGGDSIAMTIDAEAVHLFDAETERAL
jgi:multiple sugar transport system ATP-binding protein